MVPDSVKWTLNINYHIEQAHTQHLGGSWYMQDRTEEGAGCDSDTAGGGAGGGGHPLGESWSWNSLLKFPGVKWCQQSHWWKHHLLPVEILRQPDGSYPIIQGAARSLPLLSVSHVCREWKQIWRLALAILCKQDKTVKTSVCAGTEYQEGRRVPFSAHIARCRLFSGKGAWPWPRWLFLEEETLKNDWQVGRHY